MCDKRCRNPPTGSTVPIWIIVAVAIKMAVFSNTILPYSKMVDRKSLNVLFLVHDKK
jgi:hypothetical protein